MNEKVQVRLNTLAVHRVGNKSKEEGVVIAKDLVDLRDEQLSQLLLGYFLSPFKQEEYFRFTHTSDLALNELFAYATLMFNEPEKFYAYTVHILNHLYEQSDHPKVKSGELYVAYFSGCLMEEDYVDAIGIFKSENKDNFLSFEEAGGDLSMSYHAGINLKSVDKGCLIFNTEAEDGYRVKLVDANSTDALFWKEDFLGVAEIKDTNFNTKTYLNLCKDFSEEVFAKSESKKEQIDFISRSVDYFSKNDNFNLEEFTSSVIDEPESAERFKNYSQAFAEERDIEGFQDFAINKNTVRNMKRKFRNFIKLDTQIEIKFSGYNPEQSEQYVERGFDEERGMHFYKVFFHSES
ncbi:nucleoid-associated protein [Pontibacter sp. SGAir0037]|uniref:nucleoid-associated protein n=1 Tax=Pontibacter sp. SGAir0037 TaxID=2571030 RepID=UPI0010CD36A0|nr:nucleoid-associated protein [Pontibacter sp. SGAir0037]QCR22953.1 nucleoid-associated protein [Pontibacter sp. SGAir0037]